MLQCSAVATLSSYLRHGGYVLPGIFTVCLTVCLSVSNLTQKKLLIRFYATLPEIYLWTRLSISHSHQDPDVEMVLRDRASFTLAHIYAKMIGSSCKFYRRCMFRQRSVQ